MPPAFLIVGRSAVSTIVDRLREFIHPRVNSTLMLRQSNSDAASRTQRQPCRRGVIAVLTRGRQWLMIQRAVGVPQGGAWCFPGGGIESGESPSAALVREVAEEVGLVVTPGERVWQWTRDDGLLHLQWWTAAVVGGVVTPDPREVADVRWMSVDEIRHTTNILANNLEFIAYAERCGLLPG